MDRRGAIARKRRTRRAATLRAAHLAGAVTWLLFMVPARALAQSPAPTPLRAMDPRGGTPASMVGDPVLAAVAVLALGILTAAATGLLIFLMRRLRDEDGPPSIGR